MAVIGFSIIEKIPLPLCRTREVFPCMSAWAWTIRPPNACPMHWCPRQTPRMGIRSSNARIASREIPASSGPPGPGEITRPAGFRSASSSTVIASLRNTATSAPSSLKYCTRFQVNES